MFLYIKDFFQKKLFHILLIIFCGLLMLNSIMTLIDLKNYEVGIDYSRKISEYYEIENVDGKLQITVRRPTVTAKYKYAGMPNKFTWVSGQLLEKNIEVESFIVEYKVYDNKIKKLVVDAFTVKYTGRGYQEPITKKYDEYTNFSAVEMNIIDYDLKFNVQVYLPHIFVILASAGFIVPSVIMLFKMKKEENGKE